MKLISRLLEKTAMGDQLYQPCLYEKFEKTGYLDLDSDLTPPCIAVSQNVRAFIWYNVPAEWDTQEFRVSGTPIRLLLNGREILSISYNNETGQKKATADLTPLLREDHNTLEIRTVVLGGEMPHTYGKLYMISDREMSISRMFTTKTRFEDLNDRWVLDYSRS